MRNRGIELERGREGRKRPTVVVPHRRRSPIAHRRRSPIVAVTLPARERASPATVPLQPPLPYRPGRGHRPPPHPYWPGRGHRPPSCRSPPCRRSSRVRGSLRTTGAGEEGADGERRAQMGRGGCRWVAYQSRRRRRRREHPHRWSAEEVELPTPSCPWCVVR
jgi:hypothetical protein